MTDLSIILPGFPTQEYARLIPSLEKNQVNTTDLLTLDAVEIAKRARLPLLDLKRLCNAVLQALQDDLGIGEAAGKVQCVDKTQHRLKKTGREMLGSWRTISTLDDAIDTALGGIPTGYITEVTGESGAGKTQFLLGLLLATQLPPPRGLSRAALYISTESALPTARLSQMLSENPILSLADPQPSLDRVISIVTPDLESQDHILQYQLPVAVRRHNIGLVVLDSVAANYRAEFERPGATRNGVNMAKRTTELVKLGQLLRDLALAEDIAVVVANQVADRFPSLDQGVESSSFLPSTQNSPLSHRGVATGALVQPTPAPPSPMTGQLFSIGHSIEPGLPNPAAPRSASHLDVMTLDHQQRWFTGWGDDSRAGAQKTPSLGLVWTTQIACRMALIKQPIYGVDVIGDGETECGELVLKRWRRWLKVVFAPWTAPSGADLEDAIEIEITGAGIRAVVDAGKEKRINDDA